MTETTKAESVDTESPDWVTETAVTVITTNGETVSVEITYKPLYQTRTFDRCGVMVNGREAFLEDFTHPHNVFEPSRVFYRFYWSTMREADWLAAGGKPGNVIENAYAESDDERWYSTENFYHAVEMALNLFRIEDDRRLNSVPADSPQVHT